MAVVTQEISIKTLGDPEVLDLTPLVQEPLRDLPLNDGIVTIFVPGSTAGITTIEFESGVVHDLQEAFDRQIPRTIPYGHNLRWGDGNGFSHVRAALCKPSLTVPFANLKLLLGNWQQIVLLDFDNRPRERRIVLQCMGE
jgi:secondary thiamine-phosphate synthase enzyme